jgi:deoxyguanosine kinase
MQNTAVLHLGSNLGDRRQHLAEARRLLQLRCGNIIRSSALYETDPWGPADQPDYLNQALVLETALSSDLLLREIQKIENEEGRERSIHWGPRTLDIDILFFNREIISQPNLSIPHPRISERRFVLVPLAEIIADYLHPESGKSIKELLDECPDAGEVRLFKEPNSEARPPNKKQLKHKFIAIEGNIGAGKTTLTKKLAADHESRIILEEFTDNPFLPKFYQNPERYAFPVELFFMTERFKQLQAELVQAQLFSDTVIADYFFIKTLLFAKKNLPEEEYRLFKQLFQVLNQHARKPDLILYIHRPVPELLKNIRKRGRNMEDQVDPEYLANIQEAYFDFFKAGEEWSIVVLDAGQMDFESSEKDYDFIIELLNRDIQPGVQYIKPS